MANPEVHNASPAVALAASAGRMPRGRKVPPLVPEYKHIATMPLNELPQVDHKRWLLAALPGVPAGSKLLSHSPCNGGESHASSNVAQCTFGIFFTQQEFLARATKCLQQEQGVRSVLKGKRLLLLQRIAEDINWPDKTLFDELKQGFEVVGCQPPSSVFGTELRPALSSVDQFKQSMKFMRPALIGKVKAAKEAGHHGALWDLTVKEAESGLLDGPHPLDCFDAKYAGAWMPVRRFGVMQSSGSKS